MCVCACVCVCDIERHYSANSGSRKKRTILSFVQCASRIAVAVELVWQNANSRPTAANKVATKSHRGRVEFGRPA